MTWHRCENYARTEPTVELERLDAILDTPRRLLETYSDRELEVIEKRVENLRWKMIQEGDCEICGLPLVSYSRSK